jgi:hypothetical protein
MKFRSSKQIHKHLFPCIIVGSISIIGTNPISYAVGSSRINLVKRNNGSLIYATILPTPDSSGKPLSEAKSLKRIAGNRYNRDF